MYKPTSIRLTLARYLHAGLLCVGCCGLLATAAYADVYKWTDRDGRLHYTDRPPPPDGHLISIGHAAHAAETPAETPAAADAANPAKPPVATPLPPADKATLGRLKAGVAADVAAHDAQACEGAQERYRQYIGSRRLFRTDEHDQRVYLSDAEMEAARIQARREVEELCGHAP